MLHACDLNKEEWDAWSRDCELPGYVGAQIYQWIFQKGNCDPLSYSNLSTKIRNMLRESFNWKMAEIESILTSKDGSKKILLKLEDSTLIEMVLMPHEGRNTLCVSCQSGCRMGCSFCQTGKMGFKRNLTSAEILLQVILANTFLSEEQSLKGITNIVFMGMGEPMDNFDAVVKACFTLTDPKGFNLSKSRVTISTAGLVPEIEKLGKLLPIRLAVSLHSADNTIRDKMMPINRKYPLEELKKALINYPSSHGITIEYIMIENVNDSDNDAKKLVHFLHGLKAKVNLIPMNYFPGMDLKPSRNSRLTAFQSYLSKRSIPAPIRYSKGQDIMAACGQLAAKRKNELDLDPRVLRRKNK